MLAAVIVLATVSGDDNAWDASTVVRSRSLWVGGGGEQIAMGGGGEGCSVSVR